MVHPRCARYACHPTRSVPSVVRRFSAAIITGLIAVGVFAPASLAASPTTHATKAVPKVVFIVGPAGAATDGYRAQARAAAVIARRYTPDVVELYSPNATWPAVEEALAGASLVVYMGHGNGFPSRYRDELYPPTQNGFGLNPSPGGGDSTHQYFGEGIVGSQVKLARNAVVLLNHLCYASGLSEPNLPEGTLAVARQRVDNYAAGFVKAGASAVIAEAYDSPSYFVRAILGGGRSIQSAWQNSPSANGHRIAFASQRSPGYVAQMDTRTASSGFSRSIVMKAGLAPRDIRAGAAGSSAGTDATVSALPLEPTLIGTGLTLGAPDIASLPSAGSAAKIDVPFKIKDRKALPTDLQASVRWDPIDVPIVATDPATEVSGAAPTASPSPSTAATSAASPPPAASPAPAVAAPGPSASAAAPAPKSAATTKKPAKAASATAPAATTAPSASPSASPSAAPTATAAADPVPDQPKGRRVTPKPARIVPRLEPPTEQLDLVVPERTGDVVSPAAVKIGKKAITVPVTLPAAPGRYRLTITVHDADGVAYDAATQALLPSLIVRVTGDFDGAIQAAPTAQIEAGTGLNLGVRVVNLGVAAWGHKAIPPTSNLSGYIKAEAANVVGTWIPLSIGAAAPIDPAAPPLSASLPIALAPGKTADATLELRAPVASGDYLLMLDIVTPEHGSLVASGADPTIVRVTVLPAVTP